MTWTYTDSAQTIVWKDLGNGQQASCLASTLDPSDLASVQPYVPPAPPVPESISRRQFFQQLSVQAVCTNSEALSAVSTGAIPSALAALVAKLPAAQQFGAQMMISGDLTFERHHPLVIQMGSGFGWTPAQIDACWQAASVL